MKPSEQFPNRSTLYLGAILVLGIVGFIVDGSREQLSAATWTLSALVTWVWRTGVLLALWRIGSNLKGGK